METSQCAKDLANLAPIINKILKGKCDSLFWFSGFWFIDLLIDIMRSD